MAAVGYWRSEDTLRLLRRINNIQHRTNVSNWLDEDIYVSLNENDIQTRESWASHIVNTLINVVSNAGYMFLFKKEQVYLKFVHFWYNISYCVSKSIDYKLPKASHRNLLEDLDRFERIFGFDYWNTFMDTLSGETIFDETDIGYKTRRHFPYFIYTLINVDKSPVVLAEIEEEKKIQEELEKLYEDEMSALQHPNSTKSDNADIY
jgi:hypothetical protein